MNPADVSSPVLWPLLVFAGVAVLVAIAMPALSFVLGERRRSRRDPAPYECGIVSTGSMQVRFDVKFYLVAMFFVVFDLEAAFIVGWAVAAREAGWSGYVEVFVFVGILAAALFYLWRVGALEWGTWGHRRLKRPSGKLN